MKFRLFVCLALLSVVVVPVSLFSQAAEISPYAGYQWLGNFGDVGEFKGGQILGVRGGGFVNPNFEIGGNFSWNNHFQPRRSNETAALAGNLGFPQGGVQSRLWEAEFSYHFAKRTMFGSSVKPYAVVGFGALRTKINDEGTFVLNVRSVTIQDSKTVNLASGLSKENWAPQTVYFANDVIESGDTFFTFSYGGGLKAMRLWGPVGVFGDFRGRTVPNFFGHSNTFPELSAGLNFSWGEK